jgi:predicted RNA binding protein YcfA (HicA-like mRNA interferase family)
MARMPQVSSAELIRFLKAQGFEEDRQTGSHLTLRHTNRGISVTVPVHTGIDMGRGLAIRILKDAGFSVDDYLKLR